jgi:hypothetical protein
MSLPIHERALPHGRGAHAVKWNVRAAVTRAIHAAAAAIKEGSEIALTLAGALAIMVASLALNAWIWVPRSGH